MRVDAKTGGKVLSLLGILILSTVAVSPAAEPAADAALRAAVEERLTAADLVAPETLEVEVAEGAVTLRGTVETLHAVTRAGVLAGGVRGVTAVDNQLWVSELSRDDRLIRRELRRALNRRLAGRVFDWVEAVADGGYVILTGGVRDPATANRVLRDVRRIPGVWGVVDSVEVLPLSAFDERLRHQALATLYGHPAFAGGATEGEPSVHLLVTGGRLTLQGTVPTPALARLAESLLRSATLAESVHNHLRVGREGGG